MPSVTVYLSEEDYLILSKEAKLRDFKSASTFAGNILEKWITENLGGE
ncbi:hypothetical protein ES703_83890 [subsurface metagenome]